jgi:hypothetical protein
MYVHSTQRFAQAVSALKNDLGKTFRAGQPRITDFATAAERLKTAVKSAHEAAETDSILSVGEARRTARVLEQIPNLIKIATELHLNDPERGTVCRRVIMTLDTSETSERVRLVDEVISESQFVPAHVEYGKLLYSAASVFEVCKSAGLQPQVEIDNSVLPFRTLISIQWDIKDYLS